MNLEESAAAAVDGGDATKLLGQVADELEAQ
jgi:hypothetical protein